MNATTSSFVTLPFGPVPVIRLMFKLFCFANALTAGTESTLPTAGEASIAFITSSLVTLPPLAVPVIELISILLRSANARTPNQTNSMLSNQLLTWSIRYFVITTLLRASCCVYSLLATLSCLSWFIISFSFNFDIN
jgi:hypothetical protein